jgi:hypothetical protein
MGMRDKAESANTALNHGKPCIPMHSNQQIMSHNKLEELTFLNEMERFVMVCNG